MVNTIATLTARVKVLKGALEAVAEGGLLNGPTTLHDEMLGIVYAAITQETRE